MPKSLEIFLMYLLVIISLLITLSIHEFGHYIFARAFKVHVKEYSIGVGPIIWSKKTKSNLLISLKVIPVIAYVLLDSESLRELFKNDVNNKRYQWYMEPTPKNRIPLEGSKTWQYILIMLGGVLFNFLLFLILLGPLYGYALAIGSFDLTKLNPFSQLGQTIILIGKNMIFIGDGSFISQIPAIAGDKNWLFLMFNSLVMVNLLTVFFNLVPLPPLDGWKIFQKSFETIRHKKISKKSEEYLMWFGLFILLWIFISPFINDLIPREPSLLFGIL